jgi:hypothetical protein
LAARESRRIILELVSKLLLACARLGRTYSRKQRQMETMIKFFPGVCCGGRG